MTECFHSKEIHGVGRRIEASFLYQNEFTGFLAAGVLALGLLIRTWASPIGLHLAHPLKDHKSWMCG
jgi:hypothetical protein